MMRKIRDALILATLFAAVTLGGSVQPWSWSVLSAVVGVLLVLWAPKRRLGGWADVAILGVIILALCAFLPAPFALHGSWRSQLALGYRLDLPPTISLQPWLTVESFILLMLGVGWLYLIAGCEWSPSTRLHLATAACLGFMLITLMALAQTFAGVSIPLWPSQHGFGPFPNRNQNALFFVLGTILTLPLLEHSIKHKNPRCVLWLFCIAVFVGAIGVGRSRAGVILLAVGTLAWLLSQGRLAPRTALIILAGALGVAALMMVFGGESVQRLVKGEAWTRLLVDWRWAVQRDALHMASQAGPFGVGLGNFDALFALFRNASLSFNRPIHPESDVLWLATELGPFAILLLLVVTFSFCKRLFPLGTHLSSLRSAAFAVTCTVGLHAFVDVSLHRPGTFFSALFVIALGLHVRPTATSARFAHPALRLLGAVLIISSLWFASQVWGEKGPPGTHMLERHLLTAIELREAGHSDLAEAHVAAAQRIAPLDWRSHREKGLLLANGPRWTEAARAFRLVRRLEPGNVWIPLSEIWAWLNSARPQMAIHGIVECVKREAFDTERADLAAVFIFLRSQPKIANELLERLADYPAQALALINGAQIVGPPAVATAAAWVARDPELRSLSDDLRRNVFEILWQDPAHRIRILHGFARQEKWTRPTWPLIARNEAEAGDHKLAVEILRKNLTPPALPPRDSKRDRRQLERDLQINGANYAAAYQLLDVYCELGLFEDAAALCEKMLADPHTPGYWRFLHGEVEIQRGRWEAAWQALTKFANLR